MPWMSRTATFKSEVAYFVTLGVTCWLLMCAVSFSCLFIIPCNCGLKGVNSGHTVGWPVWKCFQSNLHRTSSDCIGTSYTWILLNGADALHHVSVQPWPVGVPRNVVPPSGWWSKSYFVLASIPVHSPLVLARPNWTPFPGTFTTDY